jgi:ComF family protein
VLELLLPQRCVVCGTPGAQVCGGCRDTLPRITPPLCERCGAPTAWPVARCRECAGRRIAFTRARAALEYDDRVRALVSAWKERGLRALAALAAELVTDALVRPRAAALTFVPADRDRGLWRGHQPPERLAVELGERWELPVEPLLARTRTTPRQRGLTLAERRRNVRGAFAATRPVPRAIVVVDDVYTSGATVAAAASALRKGGAARVEIVTFARAVR